MTPNDFRRFLLAEHHFESSTIKMAEALVQGNLPEARRQRWFACLNLLRQARLAPDEKLVQTSRATVAKILRYDHAKSDIKVTYETH